MNATASNQFCWIECAARLPDGGMARNQFVDRNDSEQIGKWIQRYGNTDLFTSIEQYERPDFNSPSICPIIFDIDCADDLPGTRESVLMLCELLMDRLGITPEHIYIYFSGCKGFHVVIPCEVFLPFPAGNGLLLNKKMAEKAASLGIRYLDLGVYTKKRLLRYPNSIHSKTGLYKILVSYEELRDTGMEGILMAAHKPRSDDPLIPQKPCPTAVQWYQKAIAVFQRSSGKKGFSKAVFHGFKQGWRMVPCVRQIEQAVLSDGIRHAMYRVLARYYAYLKMHPAEMTERLETLDQRNPIRDPDFIERIIKSGCQYPGFAGCDSVLKQFCHREHCFYIKLKNQD